MRTLLRWLALVLALIAARVLIAAAILGGIIFVIGAGLQAAHLPVPTVAQIEARIAPALHQIEPELQRLRGAASAPAPANSAAASAPQPAQSAP